MRGEASIIYDALHLKTTAYFTHTDSLLHLIPIVTANPGSPPAPRVGTGQDSTGNVP